MSQTPRELGAQAHAAREADTDRRHAWGADRDQASGAPLLAGLPELDDHLRGAMAAAGLVGSWEWDIAADRVRANEPFARFFGVEPDAAAQGQPIETFMASLHPGDRERVRASIERAVETGEEYVCEYRVRGLGEQERWVVARGRCYPGPDGRPAHFPGVLIDITDRKATEEALRASEARLRESEARLEGIVNSIDQMIWSTRPDGFHDYYNARWYEFTGVPPGSTDGEAWNGMFHSEDQERAWALWRHSLATGEPYHIEYRLRHHTGEYRWVIGRAQCVRDEGGRITRWYGTCTDIHDLKEAEEARDLIARELQHRIKNVFALVSSLVAMSGRGAPEAKPFADRLQARLSALALAHDAIHPDDGSHATSGPNEQTLHSLIRMVLAPHEEVPGQRIEIGGDDMAVDAQQATALALLLHELATNAVKHGSLAASDGRVLIRGTAQPGGFRLVWEEQGGAAVAEPTRRGFGTQLADRVVAGQLGAMLTREWRPDGLRVTIEMPWTEKATPDRPRSR